MVIAQQENDEKTLKSWEKNFNVNNTVQYYFRQTYRY